MLSDVSRFASYKEKEFAVALEAVTEDEILELGPRGDGLENSARRTA